MALDLSAVEREVSENTDAVASASALLTTLAQEVRNTAGDPAAVAALADRLDQNNQALSAAVTANTPQAGTTNPNPNPTPENPPVEQPPVEQPPANPGDQPEPPQ